MTTLRAAVLIAFVATAAFASAPTLVLEPAGPYHAGDSVRVQWNGLPADIHELELLLVRGGHADDVIRMTPQLDPRRGEFVWRVPRLGAEDAVLVLRAGNEREEIELAASHRFAIVSASANAAVLFRDGEWWDGDPGDPLAPAEARIDTPHERMHGRKTLEISRVRGRVPVSIAVSDASGTNVIAPEVPTPRWSAAPLTIPQRK